MDERDRKTAAENRAARRSRFTPQELGLISHALRMLVISSSQDAQQMRALGLNSSAVTFLETVKEASELYDRIHKGEFDGPL